MRKRLTRVAPLSAGVVVGLLYTVAGLIAVPVLLLIFLVNQQVGTAPPAGPSVIFACMLPVIYGIAGFIGGVLVAFLYNLIARWTGGLEFETAEVKPAYPVIPPAPPFQG